MDALTPYGVRHAEVPLTPANVWTAMQGRPVRTDPAVT
jgi:carbon-monoxide dehydrogenase large subunit